MIQNKNKLSLPKLKKIIISKGIHSSVIQYIEYFQFVFLCLTGQKAIVLKSKKAIAGFKLRKDFPISLFVTLRRNKMKDFLNRLITFNLVRIKDFKGVYNLQKNNKKENNFDYHGNITFPIKDSTIFLELSKKNLYYIENIKKIKNVPNSLNKLPEITGLSITLVFENSTKENTQEYLKKLNFPF